MILMVTLLQHDLSMLNCPDSFIRSIVTITRDLSRHLIHALLSSRQNIVPIQVSKLPQKSSFITFSFEKCV